ncbi:hypothetical protein F5148DRAFT_416829 [Russula earlei]|uniref:Uncharacterized protein n=1 Tax=Russula earlei TaxID=71964 RepID=A0ACC0U1P3_9AGAM|nr:hypothetical protein F5148DRAFT_416829 [Russula earlei]
MNSTTMHVNSYPTMEDGFAISSAGYLLPRSGLAALEPGLTHDNRVGISSLEVQQHWLEMNVSVFDHQLFAHGLLGDVVPFPPDPSHPATFNLSRFERDVHIPQGSRGTTGDADYKFAVGLHHDSIPAIGSVSVFPEHRSAMDGTQNIIHAPLPKATNIGGDSVGSGLGFFAGKDTPSPSSGANPAHAFPTIFSSPSSQGVRSAQSPSPTFLPYSLRSSSTPTSVSHASAYGELKRDPSRTITPNHGGLMSSTELLQQPTAHPSPPKECCAALDNSVRTLRSVRTRFGDVYAEHEICPDRVGGRWVCQCGSTFARDSDWERHAMHSLSHSAGGGFDCNICDISFTRSDAMFRHRRKKHGDPKPNSSGPREREDERSQRFSRERQQTRYPTPNNKSRSHGL